MSVHLWVLTYWLALQYFNDFYRHLDFCFGQGQTKGCKVMSIRAAIYVPNPSSDCISYTHVLNSSNHPQGFPDAAELKESLIWAKYSFSASSKVVNPHHWVFFSTKKLFFISYALSNLNSHSFRGKTSLLTNKGSWCFQTEDMPQLI